MRQIFEELQAGDGIEGILTFLDNNILMTIATTERFRDEFAATVSEILENYSESFFQSKL